MGGTYSTHGRHRKFVLIFRSKNLKGRDHSEDLGLDERTIFIMDVRDISWEGVNWRHLAQDRDQYGLL